MSNFEDIQAASRMRDLIERIASKAVDVKRPLPRIGTVHHVDIGRQLAWILFPGETTDSLTQVRCALNMMPRKSIAVDGDEADIVRIAGWTGNYYIADFVRGVPQDVETILNPPVPPPDTASIGKFDWFVSTATTSIPSGGSLTQVTAGWSRTANTPDPGYLTHSSGNFTLLVSGTFHINFSASFDNNAAGRRIVAIYINGSETRRVDIGPSSFATPEVTHLRNCVAGDVISARVYQNSGAALNLGSSPGHDFQVMRTAY